jgi:23S rRNA (pseudouridine1915-N3)-methyltransferase
MECTVVAVGKLRSFYREACDEYAARLGRYATFREIEVREEGREPTMAARQSHEAARIEAKLPDGPATLVALTRHGARWSSAELARELDRWLLAARPVALMIGGSHGLAPRLLERAAARWSLGTLTLPHELARVVVVEQLYRAFTILRGEPYHKGSPDGP